jgi:hypothetical protein
VTACNLSDRFSTNLISNCHEQLGWSKGMHAFLIYSIAIFVWQAYI